MNEIEKYIEQLRKQIAATSENIESFKLMLTWDAEDPELKSILEDLEKEKVFLEQYIKSIDKIDYDFLKKEVARKDAKDLEPNKEMVTLKSEIDQYISKVRAKIRTELAIRDNLFEQAEELVKAIKVQGKGKVQELVELKIQKKAEGYVKKLVPYGALVIDVAKLFFPATKVHPPKLQALAVAAIKESLLKSTIEKDKYVDSVRDYLLSWTEDTYKYHSINVRESVVAMRAMRSWILNQSLSEEINSNLLRAIETWRREALQECFTLAKVTITQVCSSDEYSGIDKEMVLKTQFSDGWRSNNAILEQLENAGINVSNLVIETAELKKFFPNCQIRFSAKIKNPISTQMNEDYHHRPQGSTYANARARWLRRQARERQEKKERLKKMKAQ